MATETREGTFLEIEPQGDEFFIIARNCDGMPDAGGNPHLRCFLDDLNPKHSFANKPAQDDQDVHVVLDGKLGPSPQMKL
jgi:hypothetical protein